MIDWADIANKIVAGGVLAALGFGCAWVGKKVGWLFTQTEDNAEDLNCAFEKIRNLEDYVYEQPEQE